MRSIEDDKCLVEKLILEQVAIREKTRPKLAYEIVTKYEYIYKIAQIILYSKMTYDVDVWFDYLYDDLMNRKRLSDDTEIIKKSYITQVINRLRKINLYLKENYHELIFESSVAFFDPMKTRQWYINECERLIDDLSSRKESVLKKAEEGYYLKTGERRIKLPPIRRDLKFLLYET